MDYRMEKPGMELRPSLLGYGCMRFPVNKDHTVDEEKAQQLIDRAMEAGVTYYDTAWFYHDGESEPMMGRLLSRYPRESYCLATKMPCAIIDSLEQAKDIFAKQFERLQTDYFDFYLLHSLSGRSWKKMLELGVVDFLEQCHREGKFRWFGFSFHDEYEAFEEILRARDWDFCQIQYNYMDEHSQAGVEGLRYANKKGLPVIIMEPLRGGRLVNLLPEPAKELFRKDEQHRTPAELALKWLYNQPEVTCVLSGMNSMEMVEQNVKTASESLVGCLTESDQELIEKVKAEIKKNVKVGCTGCGYCMPCPRGVDIPGTFRCYNAMYSEGKKSGRRDYLQCTAFRKDTSSASQCISCGKCETHCPQHIEIRKELKNAAAELEDVKYKVMKTGIQLLKLW